MAFIIGPLRSGAISLAIAPATKKLPVCIQLSTTAEPFAVPSCEPFSHTCVWLYYLVSKASSSFVHMVNSYSFFKMPLQSPYLWKALPNQLSFGKVRHSVLSTSTWYCAFLPCTQFSEPVYLLILPFRLWTTWEQGLLLAHFFIFFFGIEQRLWCLMSVSPGAFTNLLYILGKVLSFLQVP